ncbi:MAG: hypothetical protein MHM6MM_002130 [Cercozoa sp. M6MM]
MSERGSEFKRDSMSQSFHPHAGYGPRHQQGGMMHPGQGGMMPAPGQGMVAPQMQQQQQDPLTGLTEADFADCDYRHMHPVTPVWPATTSTARAVPLSLAVCSQPLCELEGESQTPLPVVNMSTDGVVRCSACRAYINKFTEFLSQGKQWKCVLCGCVNETPKHYMSPLMQTQQGTQIRCDLRDRPELRRGTYEIIPPAEYSVPERGPMAPGYFFVVDISNAARSVDLLRHVACAIASSIESQQMPGHASERTRFGLITYDGSVTFHLFGSGRRKARAISLPVTSEPNNTNVESLKQLLEKTGVFLPCKRSELFVPLSQSQELIESVLSTLPDTVPPAPPVNSDSCLLAAVAAAVATVMGTAGKVILVSAALPCVGFGALTTRENPRLRGADEEHKVFLPASPAYRTLAMLAARQYVGIDVHLVRCPAPAAAQLQVGQQQQQQQQRGEREDFVYADAATVSLLARHSGGDFHSYKARAKVIGAPDNETLDSLAPLRVQLQLALTRKQGWEAVMRLRPSRGLKLDKYHGNFFLRSNDLMTLPSIHAGHSFVAYFVLQQDRLPNVAAMSSGDPTSRAQLPQFVFVQAALLYTTSEGERRIRVHTIRMSVSEDWRLVAAHANASLWAQACARAAAQEVMQKGMRAAREFVQNSAVALLRAYRNPHQSSQQQQVLPLSSLNDLPENLRLLPQLVLGLLKCDAFKDSNQLSADERVSAMRDVYTACVQTLDAYLRPRLLRVPTGEALPCSSSSLADGTCVALWDNGLEQALWIGAQAQMPSQQEYLPVQEYLRSSLTQYQMLRRVVSGAALTNADKAFMGERLFDDQSRHVMGLQAFVSYLQRNTVGRVGEQSSQANRGRK